MNESQPLEALLSSLPSWVGPVSAMALGLALAVFLVVSFSEAWSATAPKREDQPTDATPPSA